MQTIKKGILGGAIVVLADAAIDTVPLLTVVAAVRGCLEYIRSMKEILEAVHEPDPKYAQMEKDLLQALKESPSRNA